MHGSFWRERLDRGRAEHLRHAAQGRQRREAEYEKDDNGAPPPRTQLAESAGADQRHDSDSFAMARAKDPANALDPCQNRWCRSPYIHHFFGRAGHQRCWSKTERLPPRSRPDAGVLQFRAMVGSCYSGWSDVVLV
jgi:hypothetical protein